MKKYVPDLIITVIAISFTAFSLAKDAVPWQQIRYAIHNGNTISTEKTFSSYSFQTPAPTLSCPGVGIVCWFSVFDLNNNGTIEASEFTTRANALDTDSDGIISDNQAETPGVYQEKQDGGS